MNIPATYIPLHDFDEDSHIKISVDGEREEEDFILNQNFLEPDENHNNNINNPIKFKKIFLLILVIVVIIFVDILIQNRVHKYNLGLTKITILVSIDSFSPMYFNFNVTPTLASLAFNGTSAKYLEPVFPSSTFPNHYTIVTGLYPESHGIVSNFFYDPSDKSVFHYSNTGKWWGGEPIWITAEKNDIVSATCMWPGSEAENHNLRPTYYRNFDAHMDVKSKVDILFSWLESAKIPRFLALYIPEVDQMGHAHGPNSSQVKDALKKVDEGILYLLNGLYDRDLRGNVDLIVLSDHGMLEISTENTIYLDSKKTTSDLFYFFFEGCYAFVYPYQEKDLENIYEDFKNYSLKLGHFKVWLKNEIPLRYHYTNNVRIPEILLVADVGWVFGNTPTVPPFETKGTHGYDPTISEMHAIFIADGPSFKKNTIVEGFKNLEIYNILSVVLGISPAPNNSTAGGAPDILL